MMRSVTAGRRRRGLGPPAAAMIAAAALIGCATAAAEDAEAPAYPSWFNQELAATENAGYPDLADIPAAPRAQGDAAYWAQLEADLHAARNALDRAPRAGPLAPRAAEPPAAFRDDAERLLDSTAARY